MTTSGSGPSRFFDDMSRLMTNAMGVSMRTPFSWTNSFSPYQFSETFQRRRANRTTVFSASSSCCWPSTWAC